LLYRSKASTSDFDLLFQEAVVALWVDPVDFYKEQLPNDAIARMYKAFADGR
jgi:hypothetical protein